MLETIFAKAALAKAAAVIGSLSIATTGAAVANVLPGAAQDGVAAAIEAVSPLDLPDSDDKRQDAEHRKDSDVADHKPEVPAGQQPQVQPNPNAESNFGADISQRARNTEDKGKDFGQDVSKDARNRYQPPAAGTQRPSPPTSTPTASNNPGTSYRESAPTADNNPGSGYRR